MASRFLPDDGTLLRYALIAIAVLIAAVTLVGLAAAVALMIVRQDQPTPGHILILAGLLVAGLAAWGVALTAIAVSRQVERLSERATTIEQQTAVLAEQSVARTQADTYVGTYVTDLAQLRDLLAEIRETLLLPENERARRFEKLVNDSIARHLAAAESFVGSREFHRARQELAALVERFGPDERIRKAHARLEQAAEAARANDITEVSARIENLMGLTRWDEAWHAARELVAKYPLAPEPAALAERVQRERKLFEQRNRERMHQEIQQFVHQRRWQEALQAARRFIQTFPTGPDTDSLRTQLETLEGNADIQARQSLERRIKEYLQQQKYWDALALARRIIAEHPLSPQANALRAQLPRLEDLARKQGQ